MAGYHDFGTSRKRPYGAISPKNSSLYGTAVEKRGESIYDKKVLGDVMSVSMHSGEFFCQGDEWIPHSAKVKDVLGRAFENEAQPKFLIREIGGNVRTLCLLCWDGTGNICNAPGYGRLPAQWKRLLVAHKKNFETIHHKLRNLSDKELEACANRRLHLETPVKKTQSPISSSYKHDTTYGYITPPPSHTFHTFHDQLFLDSAVRTASSSSSSGAQQHIAPQSSLRLPSSPEGHNTPRLSAAISHSSTASNSQQRKVPTTPVRRSPLVENGPSTKRICLDCKAPIHSTEAAWKTHCTACFRRAARATPVHSRPRATSAARKCLDCPQQIGASEPAWKVRCLRCWKRTKQRG